MKSGDYGILVRDTSGRLVVTPYHKPGLGDYAILAKDISNRDVASKYIKPAKGDYAYLAQDSSGRKVAVKIGFPPPRDCPICAMVPQNFSFVAGGIALCSTGECCYDSPNWWKIINFSGNPNGVYTTNSFVKYEDANYEFCQWNGTGPGISYTMQKYAWNDSSCANLIQEYSTSSNLGSVRIAHYKGTAYWDITAAASAGGGTQTYGPTTEEEICEILNAPFTLPGVSSPCGLCRRICDSAGASFSVTPL